MGSAITLNVFRSTSTDWHSSHATGKWSHEEEETLFHIVEAVAEAQGADYLSAQPDIFWTAVAMRMRSRSPQQCRNKWCVLDKRC